MLATLDVNERSMGVGETLQDADMFVVGREWDGVVACVPIERMGLLWRLTLVLV